MSSSYDQTLFRSKPAPLNRNLPKTATNLGMEGLDGPMFRLEYGVEYFGNNQGSSLRTGSLQNCFDVCTQRGGTCAGVSYDTAYPEDDCYIKYPLSDPRPAPATRSSMVRVSSGSSLATGREIACPSPGFPDYQTTDGSLCRIACDRNVSSTNGYTFAMLIFPKSC